MLKINLNKEIKKLSHLVGQMSDDVVKRSFFHAINRAATSGKTIGAKQIAGYIKLKQSEIKKPIAVFRSVSSHAELNQMSAGIGFSDKPIALTDYKPRQTATGVSVNVKGVRKIISHAFIATMPGGHVGVFQRRQIALGKKHSDSKRRIYKNHNKEVLPIIQLYGTRVSDAAKDLPVNRPIMDRMYTAFIKNFEHDLKFNLRRAIANAKGK